MMNFMDDLPDDFDPEKESESLWWDELYEQLGGTKAKMEAARRP